MYSFKLVFICCLLYSLFSNAQDTNLKSISNYKKSQYAETLNLSDSLAIKFDSINKSFKTEINTLRIKSSSKKNLKKLSALEDKRDVELKKILTTDQFQNYLELRREQRKDMQSLIRKKQ